MSVPCDLGESLFKDGGAKGEYDIRIFVFDVDMPVWMVVVIVTCVIVVV